MSEAVVWVEERMIRYGDGEVYHGINIERRKKQRERERGYGLFDMTVDLPPRRLIKP
jgi:hypothetical protein